MCLACEQGDQDRIWALVEIISAGKLPDGRSAEDLRAMGLPLPGELYREQQPDGTVLIRQRAPSEIEKLKNSNIFECDSPS